MTMSKDVGDGKGPQSVYKCPLAPTLADVRSAECETLIGEVRIGPWPGQTRDSLVTFNYNSAADLCTSVIFNLFRF